MYKQEYCRIVKDGALNPIVTQTHRMQPAPEPEQDGPGPWTTIACELCGVVAALASVGMVYLVIVCSMERW